MSEDQSSFKDRGRHVYLLFLPLTLIYDTRFYSIGRMLRHRVDEQNPNIMGDVSTRSKQVNN